MILFHTQEIKFDLKNKRLLKKWISLVVHKNKYIIGDLNVILTNDDYLYQMNKKYLNHDYYTDVITFNYNNNNNISGDIFISIDRVKENASKYSISLIEELLRVMIHGVLHLIGYNDHNNDEIKEMRSKEAESLSLIKYKDLKW